MNDRRGAAVRDNIDVIVITSMHLSRSQIAQRTFHALLPVEDAHDGRRIPEDVDVPIGDPVRVCPGQPLLYRE